MTKQELELKKKETVIYAIGKENTIVAVVTVKANNKTTTILVLC